MKRYDSNQFSQSIIEKSKLDPGGLFDKILAAVIPEGLMKFIKNPINYILKELMGIDLTAKPKGIKGIKKSGPPPKRKSLGDALFEAMEREMKWLTKADDSSWYVPGISRSQMKNIAGLVGMAKGGRFQMGQPFIAGEKGPEAVIPSTSGLVVNRNLTQAILKAGLDRAASGGTAGGVDGGQMIITNAPTVSNTSYVDQTVSTKRHLPSLSAIS